MRNIFEALKFEPQVSIPKSIQNKPRHGEMV